MNKQIALAAMAVAMGAAAPAFAQDAPEAGAYAGLGWSETNTQGANTGALSGKLGYRFNRYVGVEGDGSIGLLSGGKDGPAGSPTHVDVKQKLAGAGYVVGFLPVTSNASLLARVGYGASSYRVGPAGAPEYNASENGLRYGVGAQLFAQSNGLRVDYTREQMSNLTDPGGALASGKDHANVWSVSLVHRF
jgi:hypothetical protein